MLQCSFTIHSSLTHPSPRWKSVRQRHIKIFLLSLNVSSLSFHHLKVTVGLIFFRSIHTFGWGEGSSAAFWSQTYSGTLLCSTCKARLKSFLFGMLLFLCPHRDASMLGLGGGGGDKSARLLSLLSPTEPPQQSESSWLAALLPLLASSVPAPPRPRLQKWREDGQPRPSHRSRVHPAASRPLSLGCGLCLAFLEVVRYQHWASHSLFPDLLGPAGERCFHNPERLLQGFAGFQRRG